ncbi:MAG: PqqD family protein [Acidimicrobiales bacterium]
MSSELIDGEVVLIAPSGKEIITLNAVGTLIWNAIDAARETEDLIDELLSALTGVERAELGQDVLAFLTELRDADLVEFVVELRDRDLVREVG